MSKSSELIDEELAELDPGEQEIFGDFLTAMATTVAGSGSYGQDLKNPEQFTWGGKTVDLSQSQVMQQLNDKFSIYLSEEMNKAFRRDIPIYFTSSPKGFFLESLDDKIDCVLFSYTSPHVGAVTIAMDNTLAASYVEALLGGRGEVGVAPGAGLSPVEKQLAGEKIGEEFVRILTKLWEVVEPTTFNYVRVDGDPMNLMLAVEDFPAVSIGYAVVLKEEVRGDITVYYDIRSLASLLQSKRTKVSYFGEEKMDVRGYTRGIPMYLSCELGRTKMTVEDIMKMQEGDVLPLHVPINDPMTITSSNRPLFKVRVGQRYGIVSAEILTRISGVIDSKMIEQSSLDEPETEPEEKE